MLTISFRHEKEKVQLCPKVDLKLAKLVKLVVKKQRRLHLLRSSPTAEQLLPERWTARASTEG